MSNNYTAIYEKSFIGTTLNSIDKSLFSGKLDMKHLAILKVMLVSLDYLLHKDSEEDNDKLEYLENKIEGFLKSCENFCTYKEVKDVFNSIYGQVCEPNSPVQLIVIVDGQEEINDSFDVYDSIIINI